MNANKWNFTAAVTNAVITGFKVIAEAKELPGNSTTNETVIP